MNKKVFNKQITKQIGAKIKKRRDDLELTIPALSELTEISKPTLNRLEQGEDIHLSYFIEVCRALRVHPKEILNIEISLKPSHKLSPQQADKEHLTDRINKLYKTDFFNSPKFVRDVIKFLQDEYNIKPTSASVSRVLNRLLDKKKLKFNIVGRQKQFFK